MPKLLKILAICFVSLSFATYASANLEKKIALVIGNGNYLYATPLANPANDARAMASKLESLGFETYTGFDLDKFGMEHLLRDFSRASRQADVNLFFYAGHGMSVDGVNYLVPVDAAFEDETALDFEAVPVDFVTRQMSLSNAVNLVFLDACRNNPLASNLSRSMGVTRSAAVQNGLAEMKVANSGKGMAIAFATSPGEVALDGEGSNSPFTTALLRHIDAENTDIAEIFTRVTGEVYESTGEAQRPWLNVSLTGPVVLNPVARVQPVTPVVPLDGQGMGTSEVANNMLEEQKLLFALARETGDVEDYRAYLDSFPNGLYANNARRMIRKLDSSVTAPVTTQTAMLGGNAPNSAQATRAASISEAGPLVLTVTPALRNMPATQATEASMNMDRTFKGNIQARLNATGNNVGSVDGQWGPKTRAGISNWQSANGLVPTGYLNEPQYQLLVSQTDGRFTPYTAPAKRVSSSSSGNRKSNNRGSNNELGAALLGVAIGTILSK